MSEGEGIPMWMRVCGGIGVALFILCFLAPQLPLLIGFYLVPFLVVSFGVGLFWKSIAMSEHSEFLDYKALSFCFLVGGVLSYILLLTCGSRELGPQGHIILSDFGQFLHDGYNWFHKVTYNIAHFKFSSYLLSGPWIPKDEIYDGVTLATILASALSIGAPAVTIFTMSLSGSDFVPKGQLLPSHDKQGVDLNAYHKMKEENSKYKIEVRNLESSLEEARRLAQIKRVNHLEDENNELREINSRFNTQVQSLKAEIHTLKEKMGKKSDFSSEVL